MRKTPLFLLQFLACTAAMGELQDDLNTSTTIEGKAMMKLTKKESDQLGQTCGKHSLETSVLKIRNGKIGKFSSTVLFQYEIQTDQGEEMFSCAGTLISDRHILTAAHCIQNLTNIAALTVTAGILCLPKQRKCGTSGTSKNIESILKFSAFTQKNNGNNGDILILQLEFPVTTDDRLSIACLPSPDAKYTEKQEIYSIKRKNPKLLNQLRYFKTKFVNPPPSANRSDCLATAHSKCKTKPCKIHNDEDDSGSGLLAVNDGRVSVLGPLKGTFEHDVSGKKIIEGDCYTDVRYYINAICKNTGVCYSQAKDTEERR